MSCDPELRQKPEGPQPDLLRPDILEEVSDGRTLEEEVTRNDLVEGARVLGLDAAEGQCQRDSDRNDEADGEGEGETLQMFFKTYFF